MLLNIYSEDGCFGTPLLKNKKKETTLNQIFKLRKQIKFKQNSKITTKTKLSEKLIPGLLPHYLRGRNYVIPTVQIKTKNKNNNSKN